MEMKQISDSTIKITIQLEDLEEARNGNGRFLGPPRKDGRIFLYHLR